MRPKVLYGWRIKVRLRLDHNVRVASHHLVDLTAIGCIVHHAGVLKLKEVSYRPHNCSIGSLSSVPDARAKSPAASVGRRVPADANGQTPETLAAVEHHTASGPSRAEASARAR